MSKQKATAPTGVESLKVPPYEMKKGEDYMSQKQRSYFREILINWRQQLLEEGGRTVHHLQDEDLNYPDPLDRATREEEYNLELRARDRERKFIKKINEALDRLDTGDYGFCDDCGAEIGIGRLQARPTATQCIDCKTVDEIREKQTGL